MPHKLKKLITMILKEYDCICSVCGKHFTARKSTAHFCSPICRTKGNREKRKLELALVDGMKCAAPSMADFIRKALGFSDIEDVDFKKMKVAVKDLTNDSCSIVYDIDDCHFVANLTMTTKERKK